MLRKYAQSVENKSHVCGTLEERWKKKKNPKLHLRETTVINQLTWELITDLWFSNMEVTGDFDKSSFGDKSLSRWVQERMEWDKFKIEITLSRSFSVKGVEKWDSCWKVWKRDEEKFYYYYFLLSWRGNKVLHADRKYTVEMKNGWCMRDTGCIFL